MKALSVRAPWWWFILHCGKDIENRDWPTNFRGTVLLHASKWWVAREVEDDFSYAISCVETQHNTIITTELLEPEAERETFQKIRARGGCIVGQVDIVDCVGESSSPWFFGKYGFVLRNPVAFAHPILCKGALGFFEVPGVGVAR